MSFAVIKTGGKQYKVAQGDVITVEKLDKPVETEFEFSEVLLYTNASPDNTRIGQPLVNGIKVKAKVLAHLKDDKKLVFKYSNKTRYKKKKGHRQPLTQIQILEITPSS